MHTRIDECIHARIIKCMYVGRLACRHLRGVTLVKKSWEDAHQHPPISMSYKSKPTNCWHANSRVKNNIIQPCLTNSTPLELWSADIPTCRPANIGLPTCIHIPHPCLTSVNRWSSNMPTHSQQKHPSNLAEPILAHMLTSNLHTYIDIDIPHPCLTSQDLWLVHICRHANHIVNKKIPQNLLDQF